MGLISLLLNKNAVITTILQSVSDSHFTCKILVLYNNMHIIGFANIKSNYFLQFHYNQMLSVEYSIFTKINYETLHYYRLPFFVKRNVVHKLTLSQHLTVLTKNNNHLNIIHKYFLPCNLHLWNIYIVSYDFTFQFNLYTQQSCSPPIKGLHYYIFL